MGEEQNNSFYFSPSMFLVIPSVSHTHILIFFPLITLALFYLFFAASVNWPILLLFYFFFLSLAHCRNVALRSPPPRTCRRS